MGAIAMRCTCPQHGAHARYGMGADTTDVVSLRNKRGDEDGWQAPPPHGTAARPRPLADYPHTTCDCRVAAARREYACRRGLCLVTRDGRGGSPAPPPHGTAARPRPLADYPHTTYDCRGAAACREDACRRGLCLVTRDGRGGSPAAPPHGTAVRLRPTAPACAATSAGRATTVRRRD